MDHYSILDHSPSQAGPETVLAEKTKAPPSLRGVSPEPLRFPGDDGGQSLNNMAQRDLDAALQLLAERAQYITGASGATIALRQDDKMICRASSGEAALEVGAHLLVDSQLWGESVRTRKMLCCDDAENDPRVNRECCRELGIASLAVMPLVRGQEVNGVFELLSGRAYAFEERDFAALERLAEMIQTALDHAEAAKRVEIEMAAAVKATWTEPEKPELEDMIEPNLVAPAQAQLASTRAECIVVPQPSLAGPELTLDGIAAEESAADFPALFVSERGNIGKCDACDFPVSEGRKLCLDCEADQLPELLPAMNPPANDTPDFLIVSEPNSWLRSHLYVVVTILLVAATVILILWHSL
jgi:putative methionine-R-sulfoxide reductase with GAF domain